jgi:hypothetical protein
MVGSYLRRLDGKTSLMIQIGPSSFVNETSAIKLGLAKKPDDTRAP